MRAMSNNPQLAIRKAVAAENMSAKNDLALQAKPRLRYMICSTPRSGSTLLGDLLTTTGVAGVPMEYFNDVNIQAFFERNKRNMGLDDYLTAIQSLRTTPNGVFGFKAHFGQITSALKTAGLTNPTQFLALFDKFIIIKRRNKLGQAISWNKALQTGRWSSLHNHVEATELPVKFDPEGISASLQRIMRGEREWEDALRQLGQNYHTVEYEELVEQPAEQIAKILAFCSIHEAHVVPKPRLEKQRDSMNSEMERQYLSFISAGRIAL
jgi:LPS sulfotransferase NodH